MIPKIIHTIWLSEDKYSDEFNKNLISWKRYNPNYEIIIWDTLKLKDSGFNINDHLFAKTAYELKRWCYASDQIRFWLLYNFGGIYLDSDVECFKSFDDLLELPYFIGYERLGLRPNVLETGVIGTIPKLDIFKIPLEYYDSHSYHNSMPNELYFIDCPYLFENLLNEHNINLKLCNDINNFRYSTDYINVLPNNYFSGGLYTYHNFSGLGHNQIYVKEIDLNNIKNNSDIYSLSYPEYNPYIVHFNPSIFIQDDKIYILLRCSTIPLLDSKGKLEYYKNIELKECNQLLIFDLNFNLLENKFITPIKLDYKCLEGILDPRIVDIIEGNLIVLGFGKIKNFIVRQTLSKINILEGKELIRIDLCENDNSHLKNWMPIIDFNSDNYTFLTLILEDKVYYRQYDKNTFKLKNEFIKDITFPKFINSKELYYRGGSLLIKYNEKYFGIIHIKDKYFKYYNCLISLDKNLNLEYIGPEIRFLEEYRIEFINGLYIKDNILYMTISFNDSIPFCYKFNIIYNYE